MSSDYNDIKLAIKSQSRYANSFSRAADQLIDLRIKASLLEIEHELRDECDCPTCTEVNQIKEKYDG